MSGESVRDVADGFLSTVDPFHCLHPFKYTIYVQEVMRVDLLTSSSILGFFPRTLDFISPPFLQYMTIDHMLTRTEAVDVYAELVPFLTMDSMIILFCCRD